MRDFALRVQVLWGLLPLLRQRALKAKSPSWPVLVLMYLYWYQYEYQTDINVSIDMNIQIHTNIHIYINMSINLNITGLKQASRQEGRDVSQG